MTVVQQRSSRPVPSDDRLREMLAPDGGAQLLRRAERADLSSLDARQLFYSYQLLSAASALVQRDRLSGLHGALYSHAERMLKEARSRSMDPCFCGLADPSKCERTMAKRQRANGWCVVRWCPRSGAAAGEVKRPVNWRRLPEIDTSDRVKRCEGCGCEGPTETHHVAPRAVFGASDFEEPNRWPVLTLCRRCHMEWHEAHDRYEPWPFDRASAEGGVCDRCADFLPVQTRDWFWFRGHEPACVSSLCEGCWGRYESTMAGYRWPPRREQGVAR